MEKRKKKMGLAFVDDDGDDALPSGVSDTSHFISQKKRREIRVATHN